MNCKRYCWKISNDQWVGLHSYFCPCSLFDKTFIWDSQILYTRTIFVCFLDVYNWRVKHQTFEIQYCWSLIVLFKTACFETLLVLKEYLGYTMIIVIVKEIIIITTTKSIIIITTTTTTEIKRWAIIYHWVNYLFLLRGHRLNDPCVRSTVRAWEKVCEF